MFKTILKMAWRNILRNRKRTFFTVISVAVGVMMLIIAKSYISGIINNASETLIKTDIGHIKIADKEYIKKERVFPKDAMIKNSSEIINFLSKNKNIAYSEEKIKINLLISNGNRNESAVAVGGSLEGLDKSLELSKCLISGKFISSGRKELVIGKGLAKKLGVRANDKLLLVTTDINYSTYALTFKISGVFETGFSFFDKHIIFIPLKYARELLDCGDSSHEILIFLKDRNNAEKVAGDISIFLNKNRPGNNLELIPWQKDRIISGAMPMIRQVWGKIMGIILLIVALVILNTMLMSVMERYHEIGVIKAMGFKSREIFFLIFSESFFIGTVGSLTGALFGGAISAFMEKTGVNYYKLMGPKLWDNLDMPVPLFGKIVYPDFNFTILISSTLFGILIALIAVIYPAYKSSKMLPVEAFRSKLKL